MQVKISGSWRRASWAFAAACALGVPSWVAAQPSQQDNGTGARAVRLSYVEGQVQLSMNGTILAQEAPLNTPLFEGTQITTSDDGRAEIQLEDGSVARVAPDSSMTLVVLRQNSSGPETLMRMDSGLGYFELQSGDQSGSMKVEFGNNVVTASGFTVMRVDLDNPPGALAVFSGNARLDGADNLGVDVHGGETLTLEANGSQPYQLAENIDPNSWDAWNSDRDQSLTAEQADRTKATSTVADSSNPAWSDLDANGNWYDVPGTGYVWSPYEAQSLGWDPYGCGNWVWMPPYGYIWASCESWGYLPYQAGYWGYYSGIGWGWYPGGGVPWWGYGYGLGYGYGGYGYGGGAGWNFNVRNAPNRFHPPVRPRGGPVVPGDSRRISRRGGGYQPHPVVAFNRLQSTSTSAPLQTRTTPVVMNGNPVARVRPISPRPFYDHQMRGERTQTVGGMGGVRYGYMPAPRQNVGGRTQNWNTSIRPQGGPVMRESVNRGGPQGRPTSGAWGARPSTPAHSYGGGRTFGPAPSHSYGGGHSFGGGGGHSFGGGGGGGMRGSAPAGGGFGGGGGHASAPSGGGRPR